MTAHDRHDPPFIEPEGKIVEGIGDGMIVEPPGQRLPDVGSLLAVGNEMIINVLSGVCP
jgi:hypothetical protein